ncbi:type II toxin-antitoxin system RelE/ParE family toxin [Lichenicoccus roseus]|uniref:Type II toxin-antitoxin system RelE/ParE family toxin n=1 Tax=Lichenicoccus roseus TaxID=2683649 RepID=A0A5R9J8U9_9PROT|nr:type II toxin-antitoxin system RelE/ParE family toxin [Lichenicoccus roseus]TLU70638.1 type II toxin-antitoxin system RelE/ParE family toxin [Lichenicoccus roseus]
MIVRYTRQALADLDDAREFIAQERPASAMAMGQRIQHAISGLSQFPDRGRPGRVAGTRELVITRSPFIVAYRAGGGHVDVLAILHAARQWPSAFSG